MFAKIGKVYINPSQVTAVYQRGDKTVSVYTSDGMKWNVGSKRSVKDVVAQLEIVKELDYQPKVQGYEARVIT